MAESRMFDGSNWITVTDEEHRTAGDPHAQYALADGTRGAFADPLGPDDNYVTDAEKAALHSHANKTALDAVSGVNTGDQDLSGYATTASLATVATSGAYADLTGKPAIPDSPDDIGAAPATHDHTAADINSGTATDGHILTADGAGGAAWEAPPAGGGGLLPRLGPVGLIGEASWLRTEVSTGNRDCAPNVYLSPVEFHLQPITQMALLVEAVTTEGGIEFGVWERMEGGSVGQLLASASAFVGAAGLVVANIPAYVSTTHNLYLGFRKVSGSFTNESMHNNGGASASDFTYMRPSGQVSGMTHVPTSLWPSGLITDIHDIPASSLGITQWLDHPVWRYH